MSKLIDSGKRTVFDSGAVREIDNSKGRCDIVYNKAWSELTSDTFYAIMEDFVRTGNRNDVLMLLTKVIREVYADNYEIAYLDVAKHYAEGAEKYSERNMEKGLPFHSMCDSALRHYTKLKDGWCDEPHARAVLWNLLTLLYMIDNKPEMNDLPYKEEK
jgi:hypothetical protein